MFWASLAHHQGVQCQGGPKHVGADILKPYCNPNKEGTFVGLHYNN